MRIKVMYLMVFILGGLTTVNAQNEQDRKGKIQELRKAFLQEKLNLTEGESAKFWPLYEKHHADKNALRKVMKDMKVKIKENDSLTEAEFVTFIDETSDLRIQEIASDKRYIKDVLSILGVERTLKMKRLEKEFKKQVKDKREDKGGRGGPHPKH